MSNILKALNPENFAGAIETPYGVQLVARNSANNHSYMRGVQARSLQALMTACGAAAFDSLDDEARESLLWLYEQLSVEVEVMPAIVALDIPGRTA